MRGITRGVKFHLPNGTVTAQTIDLGDPVIQIKQALSNLCNLDPSVTTIIGPGNVVLHDDSTFGDCNPAEGAVFFLKSV